MLQERQFSAVALSGELSQRDRNHALQALRDGRAKVCVATDVAARGIDLPNLGLVIHADLPNDVESLQHRSGRTGRAGRKGVSVLLVPPFRRRRIDDTLRGLGIKPVWSGPPTSEDIRKLDHERMLGDAAITDEPNEEDASAGLALLAAHTPEHLAAALVRLYRAGLPAPEEVTDPGEERIARTQRDRAAERDLGGGGFDVGGRRNNADPKWLLPMICRRGNATRKDIGVIRILDEETHFEVAPVAVARFSKALRKADRGDPIIEPLPGGRPAGDAERPRGKPHQGKPHQGKPPYEKPFHGKKFHKEPGQGKSADGKAKGGKAAFEKPREGKPPGKSLGHGKGERPSKGQRLDAPGTKSKGKPRRS